MSTSDLWSLKQISIKPCAWFLMYLFYCQMVILLLHFCIPWGQSSICFRLVCCNYYCQSKIAVSMYLFHQEWFRLFRLLLSLNALIFLLLITGVIFWIVISFFLIYVFLSCPCFFSTCPFYALFLNRKSQYFGIIPH